jgi:putative addiction module component (TIGR02574 family)
MQNTTNSSAEGGWESDFQPELTDAQKAELDRRLDALDANPHEGVTWESVVDYVRRKRCR